MGMVMLTLIFLVIDIVSKIIITKSLYVGESIRILGDFFHITYVKNTGAAFSILADKTYLVLIISIIIILGIILYIYKRGINGIGEKIAYALILGGSIGNLIDRVIYGYVVDFLDFKIFGYDYPIFNMADTFIVIGVIILIIYTWRCNDYGY